MVVRVDTGVDFGAPALSVLAGVHGVGVQDTGQFDLELDGAILVEDPVDAVLVIGGGEDVRDDEFASTGDDDRIITEVAMFEQDAVVFLMYTDSVFDCAGSTGFVDKIKVKVMDASFAITAQSK